MSRTLLCIVTALALCIGMPAQDLAYYKAIQKGAPTQMQPKEFKQIERDALKNYSRPETYELLATSFGRTSEKVWGVVYGEVFCNLSSDIERTMRIGALVYELYDKSLSSSGGTLSVNLTENAQTSGRQPVFESQFELSFVM